MAIDKQRKKALAKAIKRREQRPAPRVPAPANLQANHGLQRRMSRDHLDVLQNIEFALVSAYRESHEVDDRLVGKVLVMAIRGGQPTDPRVRWAVDLLAEIRETRNDVSDELWIDGLRVIYASLLRHSNRDEGETSYLDFAAQFIV
jgi:hypothetical protein